MKKILALASLAAIASGNVYASKARLLALGEDLQTGGSIYFSDNRNIFMNAAYVNEYKDGVYLEWGSNGNSQTKKDEDHNPQAEGGFLKAAGNYVYGLHLGAESYITHEARQYLRPAYIAFPSGSNASKAHQDNQIDAFFGGEAPKFKWGTNVTYSQSKEDSNRMKQKSASVRLGLLGDKWQGFFNVAVMNEAELGALDNTGALTAGKDKFEGKLGFELGGSYDLSAVKVFAYWRHANWDQETASSVLGPVLGGNQTVIAAYTGKASFDTNRFRVGAGKEHKLTDKATLFAKLEGEMIKRAVEAKGTVKGDIDIDDYKVPLTLGMEYDAASWLTLRGSVTQYLISQADNDYDTALLAPGALSPAITGQYRPGKRTIANSTLVNTGMTLKFGNLSIDGLIGTSASNGDLSDGTAAKQKAGILSLDNLASRVAMTYRF